MVYENTIRGKHKIVGSGLENKDPEPVDFPRFFRPVLGGVI